MNATPSGGKMRDRAQSIVNGGKERADRPVTLAGAEWHAELERYDVRGEVYTTPHKFGWSGRVHAYAFLFDRDAEEYLIIVWTPDGRIDDYALECLLHEIAHVKLGHTRSRRSSAWWAQDARVRTAKEQQEEVEAQTWAEREFYRRKGYRAPGKRGVTR
jgi:hypothetical protein